MFRLKVGYLIAGITTGCVLVLTFLWSIPDGKLHIIFCNVGQGDAAYIRFPDGRDMVVDGGPDNAVLLCLGRHMPFWDRHIDIVALTHPQKDHMQGLISVLERYSVSYIVKSDVANATEGYKKFISLISQKNIPTKLVVSGDRITVGKTTLSLLWPSEGQVAKSAPTAFAGLNPVLDGSGNIPRVLGASVGELNDYSLVFSLRYGTFDAFFPGDAGRHVEAKYMAGVLAGDPVEVLKVPHHGSKTGMTREFIDWLRPALAVISVGKNSYGHPNAEALDLLASVGSRILRTDQNGDIEITSDGTKWLVDLHKVGR